MDLQIRIARKINPHLFYGWIMLAVGFLGLLATGPQESSVTKKFSVWEPLESKVSGLELTHGDRIRLETS